MKKKIVKLFTVSMLSIVLLFGTIASAATVLPLGGYEWSYDAAGWNSTDEAIKTVNCYAYAVLKMCSATYGCKIQPGQLSGKSFSLSESSIVTAVKADIGSSDFYKTTASAKPPKDFRKVALVIAPGEDYHWYEQNSQGYWSHKPGFGLVTNKDASGNVIYDPQTCNRKYVYSVKTKNYNNNKSYYTLNYSTFCGYFMVRNN